MVPDYSSVLNPCGDEVFGSYAKGEYTQLQFTFEAVAVSESFPLGVKVLYRAYSADEVYEIVETNDPEQPSTVIPQLCKVDSFPKEKKIRREDGSEETIPEGIVITLLSI